MATTPCTLEIALSNGDPINHANNITTTQAKKMAREAIQQRRQTGLTEAVDVQAANGNLADWDGVAPFHQTLPTWNRTTGQTLVINITPDIDPVGATEIAQRLKVERQTVEAWQHRGILPQREWTVGGRPAWRWATIKAWAKLTGRI